MSSAEKKNKVGHLTGGSEHEREAIQLRTYNEHLQNNKTLQGIAVSTDSVASAEQRTGIISLMDTLNEEGVLKKVIYYQLQNDRSVDLGKQSFSNPGSTPATQAYSQKAQTALRGLHQTCETSIPEKMELDDYFKCVRLRLYEEHCKGGEEHHDNLSGGSALEVFGDGVDYTESNAGIRMCLVFNADETEGCDLKYKNPDTGEIITKKAVQMSVQDPCTQSIFTHQVGALTGKRRYFLGFDLKPKDPEKLKSVGDSVSLGLAVFRKDHTFEYAGKVAPTQIRQILVERLQRENELDRSKGTETFTSADIDAAVDLRCALLGEELIKEQNSQKDAPRHRALWRVRNTDGRWHATRMSRNRTAAQDPKSDRQSGVRRTPSRQGPSQKR